MASGVCGADQALDKHLTAWVYAVVAIGIFVGIFGTLIGLFFLHRKQRDAERERRLQYWREQNSFHQNLSQMRQAARASILSLPAANSVRSTLYGNISDDSHVPMMQGTLTAPARASGLRKYVDVDDTKSEDLDDIMQQPIQSQRDDGRF